MEHYKLNGRKFSMPTGWHDVTYNDAINIISNNLGSLETFSLLSKIPLGECEKIEDYEIISSFIEAFGFLYKRPHPDEAEIPLSMKIGEEVLINPTIVYDDIRDMGKMSMGQIEDMKQLYISKIKDIQDPENEDWKPTELEMLQMMPSIVAIFVQKIKDREYDHKKAKDLTNRIKEEMSFKDVAHMGYFFFLRLNAYINGSQRDYRKAPWIKRKYKQVYRKLMTSLDSMLH